MMGVFKKLKDCEVLDLLINIASVISEMFGDDCEVAISQDREVVAIFNGHVSNRTVGSSLGPEADERINHSADGQYVNYYKTNVNNTNHDIKASTITLDLGGKFTTFCINYDISLLSQMQQNLLDFLATSGIRANSISNTTDPIEKCFAEIQEKTDKPVHLMNKQDRLKVVKYLFEKGCFKYQKSIVRTATLLGVTRHTIYNYLKELGIEAEDNTALQ